MNRILIQLLLQLFPVKTVYICKHTCYSRQGGGMGSNIKWKSSIFFPPRLEYKIWITKCNYKLSRTFYHSRDSFPLCKSQWTVILTAILPQQLLWALHLSSLRHAASQHLGLLTHEIFSLVTTQFFFFREQFATNLGSKPACGSNCHPSKNNLG